MDKTKLELMVSEHKTLDQMSEEARKSVSCVRYWLKKHSILREPNTTQTWTRDQMIEALRSSSTVSDALRKLGLAVRPGNYETVSRFVRMNDVDLSHMTGKSCGKGGLRNSLDEVMVKGSTYSRGSLKKRLMKLEMIKNVCSVCGLSETWQGKSIVMVLDHINGENCDHRLENLRMLCPNCNSQQTTFCGKAKNRGVRSVRSVRSDPRNHKGRCSDCGKTIWEESERCQECYRLLNRRALWPSKVDLENMLKTMTWVAIGKKYGVSDNAVRKWVKHYGLH